MITVHHLNNSRSQRILWLLEELGLDYQIEHYQRDSKTMLAPQELKDVHPLGKSPVITDGKNIIAESGAIIDYLVRKYSDEKMIPPTQTAQFNDYTYWMHFSEGTLMPPLLLRLVFEKIKTSPMPFFIKPIAKGIANKVLESFVTPNINANLNYIESYLKNKPWFVGEQLTGADIQMSFPLEASVARGIVGENCPNILNFVKTLQARSAYKKALEQGGEYDYA